MAKDLEMTAKYAVEEARVRYEMAAAAAAKNPGNSPDAQRDRAAAIQAKAVLDAAVAAAGSSSKVTAAPATPGVGTVTATPTGKAVPVSATAANTDTASADVGDNFAASVAEAAKADFTPNPDSIEFASLTPEQQAALGGIGEGAGLNPTLGFSAAQMPGTYTFDAKTGVLLLDGKPYTGTWNGYDYKAGEKGDPTSGAVAKSMADFADPAGGGRITLTGKSDTELAREDAFAQLQDLFDSYGLGSLAGKITEYMKQGKGPNETVLLLKQSEEYNKRFYGNTLRKAAGLNVMSESDYLQLENDYANVLRSYGLGTMLSSDRTKNEALFAKFMGNDLAKPEFKDRIELATNRVINADPVTKGLFKEFYPNLTDADLVQYFLSPSDTLPKLQEKVTSAEIGGAALAQGLETSLMSATELAKFGVDRAAAIQGYQNVKEVLPTSQKLSDIYGEAGIKYDQASGEAEFLKFNADAAEKRRRLKSLERAAFQGESGISQGSGLARSVQGAF